MNLEFLNQLNESQLVGLINYVLEKECARKNDTLAEDRKAVALKVYNEPDRCDEKGNQEILVYAWNGCFHVGSFFIKDFTMEHADVYKCDYTAALREYMTSLFGEIYIKGVQDYYSVLGTEECERLRNLSGISK